MIEKSETNSKRGPFFMFLGRKLRNRRQIPSEGFFLEIARFLRRKLNFVGRSGSLNYLGLKVSHRRKKVENHCIKSLDCFVENTCFENSQCFVVLCVFELFFEVPTLFFISTVNGVFYCSLIQIPIL